MATPAGTRTDARRAALGGLLDHAALFPPASMTMADALAEDRRVRAGREAWLVSRFVCPLTRLTELGQEQVRVAVVADADPDERLDDPRVEAVELPPGRAYDGVLGRGLEIYVERPVDDLGWLEEVRRAGARAKVRCGGASVPPVDQLAPFVRRCRELEVRFKATAGLHHPVRGEREHGFLNLLAAAVFGNEEDALAERDAGSFRLDAEAFGWRDRVAPAEAVALARRDLLVGIGSCSVQEPVDELRALGLLGP